MVKAKSDLGIISIQCFFWYTLQYYNQKAIISVYKQKDSGPYHHTSVKDKGTGCPKIWNCLVIYLTRCLNVFRIHLEQNQNYVLFGWKQYILLKLLAEKVLCLLEPDEGTKLIFPEYTYVLHDSCWKDSLLTPQRWRQ